MNALPPTIHSAIFDLDGVIVDSMAQHHNAWKGTHDMMGVPFVSEVFEKTFGMRNDDIVPFLFDIEEEDEIDRVAEYKEAEYRNEFQKHPTTVPGVEGFIRLLQQHGWKLAIATSAPKGNVEMVASVLDIFQSFETIVLGSDVAHGKPAPDIFLEAARRLNVAPQNTIVFEDSIPGIDAGKAAGMQVIGVATTHSPEDLQRADFVITNFSDPAIQQIFHFKDPSMGVL